MGFWSNKKEDTTLLTKEVNRLKDKVKNLEFERNRLRKALKWEEVRMVSIGNRLKEVYNQHFNIIKVNDEKAIKLLTDITSKLNVNNENYSQFSNMLLKVTENMFKKDVDQSEFFKKLEESFKQ